MKRNIAVILVLILVLAAAILYWQRNTDGRGPGAGGDAALPGGPGTPKAPERAAGDRPGDFVSAPPELVLDDDPSGPLRLEGQVIGADDAPVAGAVVSLSSSPPRTTETESDGSFAFDKLVPRTYQLSAHTGDRVGGPVVHDLTASSDPVVIRVAPGASLDVLVVTEDDAPIAGAAVELRQTTPRTETTDQKGQARFRGAAGGFFTVVVTASGHGVVHHPVQIPDTAGATALARIVLRKGAAIAGKVVTETGKPVAGARVLAHDASALLALESLRLDGVLTDKRGRFELGPRSAGTYRFTAAHPDHAPSSTEPITLDGATAARDIEIVVKAGGTIAGRAVDTADQPVPFAAVRVMPARGMSMGIGGQRIRQAVADERGEFRITGLARTELAVMAVTESASSEVVKVDLRPAGEARDLLLSLTVVGSIAGVVVDSAGSAVTEAQVTAYPDFWSGAPTDDFLLRGMSAATTDGGGRFELKGLLQGTYRLRASSVGVRVMELVRPGVQAVTGDSNVRLVLERPGRIKGVVQFEDGGAPLAFTVTVGFPPGVPVASGTGAFSLGDLPPGTYDVTLRGAELAPRTVPDVQVTADATTDMGTIQVKRGRSLSGRVIDAQGNAVAGAQVVAARQLMGNGKSSIADIGPGGEELFGTRRTTTDEGGNFYLSGMGSSELQLVAEHDQGGRSFPVSVPAGSASMVHDLTLRPFGSVFGVITRNREPAASVPVFASPKGGGQQMLIVRTGEDGSYVIERLPEGPHRITATLSGNDMVSASSAGKDATVKGGDKVRVDIDIQLGEVTLTVLIQGKEGATIDAAQVFLISGQASPGTAKELNDMVLRSSSGGVKQTLAMGTGKAEFQSVLPGEYSVCVIPINGDMNNPSFQMRLQQHVDQLKVYCTTMTVSATPAQQEHRAVVPPMEPLPEEPSR
jgi:hypothetical protein